VEWEISPALWFPDSSRFLANAHLAAIGTNNWSSETTSIWEISLAGSKPRKIRDNAVAWSVSPDGSLISFGTKKGRLGEREIWLMDSAGERARRLFDTDENSSVGALMWSPNQRWVIYDRTDKSGDTFLIRDLAGGAPLTLFPPAETKDIVDRNWLPDGRLIYAVREPQTIGDACNYWTMRLDGQTGLPLEQRDRATNWAGFCVDDTSVTHDGKRAVFREWMSHQTWIMADLEAGGTRLANSRPFTLDEGDIIGDWTSDSKTVLIVEDKGDHYGLSKEALDLEQKETIVPSTGGGGVQAATISSDEKWVIYQIWPNPKGPSDHPKIMRVPFSGGSPEMVFPVPDGSGFNCTKHPVDLCILIEPSSDRSVMVVSKFDPIKGTRGPEFARFDVDPKLDVESRWPFCNISPDGKRLLISRGAEGPLQILPLRGGLRQTIPLKDLSDLRLVGWTSDGNALVVVSGTKNGTVLQHVDLHGNAQVLWRCRGGQQCDAGPSPDGRHVAIQDRKVSANMWMMENF
jgi:Tol biopolymer transport system component